MSLNQTLIEITRITGGRMEYGEVCEHGGLRRNCETCDLKEDNKELLKTLHDIQSIAITKDYNDIFTLAHFAIRKA